MSRVYYSRQDNKLLWTKRTLGVRTQSEIVHRNNKVVRPRTIPYYIWKRIKAISVELGLTIPDTLNLLADLYDDLREGAIIIRERCEVVKDD